VKAALVALITFVATTGAAAPRPPSILEKVLEQVWFVAAVAEDEMFFHVYTAILWNESRYDVNAFGYNTDGSFDYGVAQLNSRTFPPNKLQRGLDPRTPTGNARIGARFFFSLLRKFGGDYEKAVRAYNCGPWRVEHDRVPPSTKIYSRRVLERAAQSLALSRD
jgi:soluble lytic murein transglycosylase-like protein